MSIYTINNQPTNEKIQSYDANNDTYYRFQNPTHAAGSQSWGQVYSTPEEALEDGSTILNGKSCCSTASKLYGFRHEFDNDYVVLVLKGWYVEVGHDDEDVVDIDEVLEIWSYDEFVSKVKEIKEAITP